MAKDQGLVLSPTKVSGQCGRLKCCLVYEQAAYAELRKGLPKLGKRVIGVRGEGRVVEVDVLRQRVRVSYGPGDTEVVPATEVKPLFPSGNQPGARDPQRPQPDDGDDPSDPSDSDEAGASGELVVAELTETSASVLVTELGSAGSSGGLLVAEFSPEGSGSLVVAPGDDADDDDPSTET
jgi:hypothetical protein